MTYAPSSYPTPYGYAAGATGQTARHAGILWLILGIVALLMGGCLTAVGAKWDALANSPAFQNNPDFQRISQELEQVGIGLDLYFIIGGIVILIYALVGIAMGITLLRSRSGTAAITAIVFDGLILLLFVLTLLLQLIGGDILGAGLTVLLLSLHALILSWLIISLRRRTPVVNPYMPYGYTPQPMQGYHYPPQSRQ